MKKIVLFIFFSWLYYHSFSQECYDAGNDTTICLNSSVILNASGGISYTWSPATGLSSTSISNPTANPTITTTYTVTVTDVNDCSASDNIVLTVRPTPTATISNGATSGILAVCLNALNPNITFNNPQGFPITVTYNINGGSNQVINVGASTTATVAAPTGTAGTYTYNLVSVAYQTAPTCSNTITGTVTITVIQPPVPSFVVINLCQTSATFVNTSTGQIDTYLWDINNDGIIENTSSTFSYSYLTPGYYLISLTITNACGAFNSKQTINIIPSSSIYNYNASCCSETETYNANSNIIIDNISSPIATPIQWTYTSPYLIKGTLTIQTGAELDINQGVIIEFGPNGKIIVERGAILRLDSCTLMGLSSCHTMWQGIEVWGISTACHFNANGTINPAGQSQQGRLYMTNSAKIMQAHNAVLLGKTNFCICPYIPPNQIHPVCNCIKYPYLPAYDGGILDANLAVFENNAVAVKILPFQPYTGSNQGAKNNNACKIINSTTIKGGHLPDPGYTTGNSYEYPCHYTYCPQYTYANTHGNAVTGIYLWGVRNVKIENDVFGNNLNNSLIEGIKSFDSPYNVSNSLFQNLDYGIRIFNTNTPLYGHIISDNNFNQISTNCLQIEGSKYDRINNINIGNNFGDPYLTAQPSNSVGIYLNNTSNFDITDNNFNRLKLGIQANNSGSGGGNIRALTRYLINTGNIFTRCYSNIITTLDNSKLNIKCNTAINQYSTEYSLHNWINISLQGLPPSVLANQGQASSTDSRKPAGNKFTPVDLNYPANDRRQITNYGVPYFYAAHSGPPERIPVPNSPSYISLNTLSHGYEDGISCKPCFAPSCYPDKIIENNALIAQLQTEYANVESNLDKGQTTVLTNAINNSISTPDGTLKSMLLNASPLSDTVLTSFIVRQHPTAPGIFKDVVVPNSPVSNNVHPFLEQKLLTLPSGIAHQIENAQAQQNSYRTLALIHREIEQLQTERQMALNALISEKTDSGDFTTVMALLEGEITVNAKQTIIGTYISENELSEATTALNNFVSSTPAETDWKELMSMLVDLGVNDKTVFEISPQQEQFIRDLAYASEVTLATVNAQAILRLLYGEEFTLNLSQQSIAKKVNETNTVYHQTTNFNWQLFPNPANNYIEITYQLPEDCTGKIEIFSVLGRKTDEILLQTNKTKDILKTNNYIAGIYYLKLSINNEYIETQKILIIK